MKISGSSWTMIIRSLNAFLVYFYDSLMIFWRFRVTIYMSCKKSTHAPVFYKSRSLRIFYSTLQRQNAENLKQIFPEKEYRGLSPNFHIHVNYIFPRWVCLFCWRKYVDRSWEYITRSQTHECGNWGWGRTIPRKGIYKRNCRCSAEQLGPKAMYWQRMNMIIWLLSLVSQTYSIDNMVPDSAATASAMFTGVKVIIVNYAQGNHAIVEYLTTWCLIALPLPLLCLRESR
jgi:hypothetical protein